jgi:hypothetical protein
MSSTGYSNQGIMESHNCSPGWIVFIAVGAALASPLAAQVNAVLSPPGVVDQTIVIPRADFSLDHVRTLAQKFLQEHNAKSTSLIRLLMVPDEASRANNLIHGLPANTYASTVDLIVAQAGSQVDHLRAY